MELLKTLGFDIPAYDHIPLLTDHEGRRLAKRDKDLDLSALCQRFTPEEILGMLAYASGVIPENRPANLDELVRVFDWKNVKKEDLRLPETLK